MFAQLTRLELDETHADYAEQFLLDEYCHLRCLYSLLIGYDNARVGYKSLHQRRDPSHLSSDENRSNERAVRLPRALRRVFCVTVTVSQIGMFNFDVKEGMSDEICLLACLHDNFNAAVSIVRRNTIGHVIIVHVASSERERLRSKTRVEDHLIGERAIGRAEENADTARAIVGNGNIQLCIRIEISHDHCIRLRTKVHRVDHLLDECATAVGEKTTNLVRARVLNHDIQSLIAVEIGHGDRNTVENCCL
jgi:hypothetical protein